MSLERRRVSGTLDALDRASRSAEKAAKDASRSLRREARAAEGTVASGRPKTAGELLDDLAARLCDAARIGGRDDLAAEFRRVWDEHFAAMKDPTEPQSGP